MLPIRSSVNIGVCLKAENNPFWAVEVRRGIEEEAKENLRANIRYRSPEKINCFSEQGAIVSRFIEEKVAGIIFAPGNPIEAIDIVEKANKADIPIVVLDTDLDSELAQKRGVRYGFVGLDDYQGGWQTGQLLIKKLPVGSNVAVIGGYLSGTYSLRVTGFFDAVFEKLKVVEILSGNFEEETAASLTRDLIARVPDVKAVFATSDNMAMGARSSLEDAGRGDVLVCGFDATHVGRMAVEKGLLLSSVDSDPAGLGRLSVQAVLNHLEGKTCNIRSHNPVKLLTRGNLLKVPKQAIQLRKYRLLDVRSDLSEFDYENIEGVGECPVLMNGRLYFDLPPRLARLNADRFFIVTDSIVDRLYAQDLKRSMRQSGLWCEELVIQAGEHSKTFSVLNELAASMLDMGATRRSVVVVLGGGVVGNIAGFLAAILMRGVRFVQVPSTVLAQIDSVIGGKQAVNMPHGKNLLGTFYEPEFIFMDTALVATLSDRDYRSGMAEAIKHALCQSREALELLKAGDYDTILRETVRLKMRLLEQDPREMAESLVLLYGHTIGHAIERASNYALTHGEAISIGMVAEAMLAVRLGYADDGLVDLHLQALQHYSLPGEMPPELSLNDVVAAMYYDKKERGGDITFYFLRDVGEPVRINGAYAVPVPAPVIRETLEKLCQLTSQKSF